MNSHCVKAKAKLSLIYASVMWEQHIKFPKNLSGSHVPFAFAQCKRTLSHHLNESVNFLRWTRAVQGSHFFGLTKFHDISMIFPGFSQKFQVYFELF